MFDANRREFLKKMAAGGASASALLAAAGLTPRRIEAQEFSRVRFRELGSTGFKASEIGMGCMNMRDPELVHAAIDQGINYIDTANTYMNGANEEVVGQVMKTKRDRVFLVTKIKWDNPGAMYDMMADSLRRLQTDHVDLMFLHVTDAREQVLRDDLMKIFETARDRGYTRFIGVSTHSNQAEVLDAAVESNHWEAVLTGYNYYSPPEVTEAIKNARLAGLGIIGMKNLITTARPRKPFPDIREDTSGRYTNQQALLKWVLSNRFLDTTIPGMTSFEQLENDIEVMGLELSFDDTEQIRRYGSETGGRYCRGVAGCTGCQDQCPYGVAVNEINRCLNYAEGYGDERLAWENYRALPRAKRLDVCSDCDECTVRCVNGVDIAGNLGRARALFT